MQEEAHKNNANNIKGNMNSQNEPGTRSQNLLLL